MKKSLWMLAPVVALSVVSANDAAACGGCLGPLNAASEVTGHRMAFAVSDTRTVLWDQFSFSGDPGEFAWVLPVKPGAYIEASTDAWFEALDAFTTVQVTPRQLNCVNRGSSGGFGCGASSDDVAATGGNAYGDPGVQVVHSGTVGPYETVTLRATEPDALYDWLSSHGYVVPQGIDSIIDAYVTEGFDFIAVRLLPGAGVDQMTPVRVITPGGDPELPLRMVAAGAGSIVPIVLFVLADERYTMPDLPEVGIVWDQLRYDYVGATSNYAALRDRALALNAGRSFLTTFARARPFDTELSSPNTLAPVSFSVSANNQLRRYTTLGELYFGQAAANDQVVIDCDASLEGLDDPRLSMENPAPGERDAASFTCASWTDLSAAMVGMHPSKLWLTRLELELPVTALDHDCLVAPALAQATVPNVVEAKRLDNPPCDESLFAPNAAGSSLAGAALGLSALGMFLRRRRRRS